MAGDVKIFLSCVSDEFGSYREALRHALTHRRVEIKIQEDFSSTGGDTLAMLEDYIESCDVVVHFIGCMAGSRPPATSVDDLFKRRPELEKRLADKGMTRQALGQLTYTQWEAWLAVGFNRDGVKRNLVIVAPANGLEPGPKFAPTKASRVSQAKHLRRLKAIDLHPGPPFTSPDNLALQVLKSAVVEPALSSAGLTVKTTPSGVALVSKPQILPFVYLAVLLAVIAGIWMFLIRPQIEAERKLLNEFDKAQSGGTIGNLKEEENSWLAQG